MCGIAGLYLKNPALYPRLGELFRPMLVAMTSRGPDSAGVALYRDPTAEGQTKYSLAHDDRAFDWQGLCNALATQLRCRCSVTQRDTHAILISDADE